MKTEDRNITWIRAISCMMVVLVHTLNYHKFISVDRFLHQLCLIAVPMFLMITGYLYTYNISKPGIRLLLKNGSKMFVPIVYFGIAYVTIKSILTPPPPPPTALIRVLWNADIAGHLSFLYGLFPIYLALTFLPIPKMSRAQARLLLFVCFIIFFITEGIKVPPFSKNSYYSFNMYLIYVLTGAAVRYIDLKSCCQRKLLSYILLILGLGVYIVSFSARYKINFFYNSIFNYTVSTIFFMFFIALPLESISFNPLGKLIDNFLSFIAQYSLGIFGWHAIFIDNLHNTFLFFHNSFGVYLLFFITLLLSLLVCIIETPLWKFINIKLSSFYFRLQLFFLKRLQLLRLLNFLFVK